MRPVLPACLALLLLSSCKEDHANRPEPVEMTAQAVGYYCQMELLNHDGPKGQMHLAGVSAPIFFSQVKDTIAYLHIPEQSHAVEATYVQDMTDAESWDRPGPWIAVEDAVYVIGSDRLGGMDAPEFVPFSSAAGAESFIARHGGTIRRFDEITSDDVFETGASEAKPKNDDNDIGARLRALSGNNEHESN